MKGSVPSVEHSNFPPYRNVIPFFSISDITRCWVINPCTFPGTVTSILKEVDEFMEIGEVRLTAGAGGRSRMRFLGRFDRKDMAARPNR